ncbi:hypothetical protein [Carbonactinospora thermoautotrophica]|uniref:hypothetical protein n=1 Tax=Carbonactinospora thermoautotrophica TaxID=1469144 RepID=UPI002271C17C|nr:hypothetical protein [Carbonactinospora thermoautotrophica]
MRRPSPPPASRNRSTPPARARPVPLPPELEAIHADYIVTLDRVPVGENTRRVYASRTRQHFAWFADAIDIGTSPGRSMPSGSVCRAW